MMKIPRFHGITGILPNISVWDIYNLQSHNWLSDM